MSAELSPADAPTLTSEDYARAKECFERPIFYENGYDFDDLFGGSGKELGRLYRCPQCGEYIEKKKKGMPKHGEKYDCHCGHSGRLYALGRMKNFRSIEQNEYFVFAKAQWGWLWLLCCEGRREFDREDLDPEPILTLTKLYAFAPGKRYTWTREWVCGVDTWQRRKSCGSAFKSRQNYMPPPAYYFLGGDAIQDTEMRYCAMEEAWREILNHDIFTEDAEIYRTDSIERYLELYSKHGCTEMLVKLGYSGIIADFLRGYGMGEWNWRTKTPWDFFRLSKADYKIFRNSAMTEKELKEKNRVSREMGMGKYLTLRSIWGTHTGEALKAYGDKRYWDKLCRWFPGHDWVMWQDTLRMEQEVGNDTEHENVLMPKHLRARHDELTEITRRIRAANTEKEYAKRRKELERKYSYSDGELEIRVPESTEEIVREGKLLKHCVAGYAERHIKGVTCILFLRWADDRDTAYCTVELSEREIRILQIHGYHNDLWSMKPGELHEEFLSGWLNWIRNGSQRDRDGEAIIRKEKGA